ncbi:MAG: hypothetical protein COA79_12220 [Planctomycetota bacterium]|nr:MAG: hypothetical protein COA79_12220 [Planctomycetota bacterium]
MNNIGKKASYESGVSQAIKSTNYAESSISSINKFTVKVAETTDEKRNAFHLAYQSYLKKGYTTESENGLLDEEYDKWMDTTIFITIDQKNKVIGTASVLYNHSNNLPCFELFDIANITQDLSTAEITRFAIDDKCKHGLQILQEMYVYLYFFSKRNFNIECFLIEVNPRHVMFYEKKLGFKIIRNGVPCPRVHGAIAVLLQTNFELFDSINKGISIKNKKLKYIYNYYRNFEFTNTTKVRSNKEQFVLSK